MLGCGGSGAGNPATGFQFFMFAAVFSCAMTSIAGNSTLPLTWSPWQCVLMIVVIGRPVSSLIAAMIGAPKFGFLVSTTVTPSPRSSTAVVPPPPRSRTSVSESFSTSTVGGPGGWPPRPAGCWKAPMVFDSGPPNRSRPSKSLRFILTLLRKERLAVQNGIIVPIRFLASS